MQDSNIQKKLLPEDALLKLGVGAVYLFGSHAEGVAGEGSDIDVGVVMKDPRAHRSKITPLYEKLYNILSDVFDMSNFRTIDIVFLERASLELCFDAITHGKVLFESSSDFRLDFEERVAAKYRDFKPLLEMFNQAVLARV